MALKVQPSFSAGELDPALREYTTLDKYKSALATARNVVISKTGRVISAPGRKFLDSVSSIFTTDDYVVHTISEIGVFIVCSYRAIRAYNIATGLIITEQSDIDLFNVANIHKISFLTIGANVNTGEATVILFEENSYSKIIEISSLTCYLHWYSSPAYYGVPASPTSVTTDVIATGSTGYAVAYAVTRVVNGQESAPYYCAQYVNLPIAAGQFNTIELGLAADTENVTEMRVYRKVYTSAASNVPTAFGFVGLGDPYSTAPGRGKFKDTGVAADYAKSPPQIDDEVSARHPGGPAAFLSKTGCVYQQKLVISEFDRVHTSRTKFPTNFTRSFPLTADSALDIKMTTSHRILFVADYDGLVTFATSGVYVHTGELTPENLSQFRKGNWVIDENIPPIVIPGGILFVDSSTNVVRMFVQSQQSVYEAEELSIFSNHLFADNKIRSWAFNEGTPSMLYVTFTDGTMATFTYERELGLKAWTRADFTNDVEWVAASKAGVGATLEGQVIDMTCPASVSDSLDVKGFKIDVGFGTVGFWIDTDDDGSLIPAWASACTFNYELTDIAADEFNYSVARKIADALREFNYTTLGLSGNAVWLGNNVVRFYGTGGTFSSGGGTDFTFTTVRAASGGAVFTTVKPQSIFITKNSNNKKYIELGVPRYVSSEIEAADPESDKNESIAAMTALVSWNGFLNDVFHFVPVVTDDWAGSLTLTCSFNGVFTNGSGNPGNVGSVLRHFDSDGSATDLLVTARVSDYSITVLPYSTFPSAYASNARLYNTHSVFTGLDHMEGESVSIISDGYVLASPNNNIDNYPVVTVSGGQITLPDGAKGAIVHIGRPYTMDIETLDIDTVEQRPTLIESMTVNKLYIKVLNSFGFYVGSKFPIGDGLVNPDNVPMEPVFDSIEVDYEEPVEVIGNRYTPRKTGRAEITLPGDWRSSGRICLRQVDPLHFEILSIIPDVQDLQRTTKKGEE